MTTWAYSTHLPWWPYSFQKEGNQLLPQMHRYFQNLLVSNPDRDVITITVIPFVTFAISFKCFYFWVSKETNFWFPTWCWICWLKWGVKPGKAWTMSNNFMKIAISKMWWRFTISKLQYNKSEPRKVWTISNNFINKEICVLLPRLQILCLNKGWLLFNKKSVTSYTHGHFPSNALLDV